MRLPPNLLALMDHGVITDVVRPLMSGKEAQVYIVRMGEDLAVAKIYKTAQERTFRHRSQYTEGRKVRNTRDARAMKKGSRHGRAMNEDAWRSAEVDIIHRLYAAGVRVPEPYHFADGVLVMELVTDGTGEPALRLAEVELDPEVSLLVFELLLRDVIRMTAAGIVHGDLSEFNILVAEDGPVIIDFPQAVDAASNPNAKKLLLRDVDNIVRFVSRTHPEFRGRPYGPELWEAYERATLTPETVLTGRWRDRRKKVNEQALLQELADVEQEEARPRSTRPDAGRPKASPGRRAASNDRSTASRATAKNARPQGQAKSHRPDEVTEPGRP